MSNLEPLFLIGSFSFLQVTRTTIKAWMSLNFGGIPPLTSELAALDQFKKSFIREYSKYLMTCCQVSDRCPLGYLYLKHHWGGGKAASGFRPDRIGTLVSMATDSSHRVIMGKISLAL